MVATIPTPTLFSQMSKDRLVSDIPRPHCPTMSAELLATIEATEALHLATYEETKGEGTQARAPSLMAVSKEYTEDLWLVYLLVLAFLAVVLSGLLFAWAKRRRRTF